MGDVRFNQEQGGYVRAKSSIDFTDCHTGQEYRAGDEFECTFERFQEMENNGIPVQPTYIEYRGTKKKSGKKIIIFQKLLYVIGGIEAWDMNLAKTFEDKNIIFVFSSADKTQMVELSKYATVMLDNGDRHYECDILINANYDGSRILLDRTKAEQIYQTIHSDFSALKRVNGWTNFELNIDPRTTHIFSASTTAQKGLKEGFGYESDVLPNILAKADTERPMVFISLTRASEEKGIGRCIQMAREFKKHNKRFIWLLCSTLNAGDSDANRRYIEQIKAIPEFIQVQPQLYTRELLKIADYCVQLSDTEAYCYTIRESLQQSVPVIATKFDEAKKVIKNEKNGLLVDFDLHDLDVEKIFSTKFDFKGYEEKVNPLWEKVMNGEL